MMRPLSESARAAPIVFFTVSSPQIFCSSMTKPGGHGRQPLGRLLGGTEPEAVPACIVSSGFPQVNSIPIPVATEAE